MSPRTSSSPRPGGTRQSTRSSARLGMTLIFSDAEIRVGVNVTPNIGSNITASARVAGAQARERARRVVRILADSTQEEQRLVRDAVLGAALGETREYRRHLQQRVVAHRRHRGVAGDAARADREAEHALLGAADAVAAPAGKLEGRRRRPR